MDHGNTIPTWTCAEVSQKDDEQQHKVVSAQGLNYRKGYMQESEIEQTLPRAIRTMRLGKHKGVLREDRKPEGCDGGAEADSLTKSAAVL